MRYSMTGFASGQGELPGLRWHWELRSVNAKGLDIRLRVPDWIEGLEQALKKRVAAQVRRGNITVSLRVHGADDSDSLSLNEPQLKVVLDAMARIESEAMERGLNLAPSTAADVVAVRGILDTARQESDPAEVCQVLLNDFNPVLNDFLAMRSQEGFAVGNVLSAMLVEIDNLVTAADAEILSRKDEQSEKLRMALARVLDNTDGLDEGRVLQELALISVKSDVTEEIDRLRVHVKAAGDLLGSDQPVGRKLDFLMQEFNREANTLCSKSQSPALTRIGLDLKTVIDQLREQVQNLE